MKTEIMENETRNNKNEYGNQYTVKGAIIS